MLIRRGVEARRPKTKLGPQFTLTSAVDRNTSAGMASFSEKSAIGSVIDSGSSVKSTSGPLSSKSSSYGLEKPSLEGKFLYMKRLRGQI